MSQFTKKLKKYIQLDKKKNQIQKECKEFMYSLKEYIEDNKLISKSEFEQIKKIIIQNNDRQIPYFMRDWYSSMKQKLSKGVKYKGYQIKSGQYPGYIHIYKNEKVIDGVRGQLDEQGIQEAKKQINLIIKSQKNAPLIMSKLGIQNLQFTVYSCKRSTVYDKQVYKIKEDKDFQKKLVKYAQQIPINKWQVKIIKNIQNIDNSQMNYLIRSQREYDYMKGDYLKITVGAKILEWGVKY